MACAALIVEAAMASAGVSFIMRQASAMTNCIDSFQLVPGLQSVARARMPSESMILRAGVYSHSASPNGVQGNETATVSDLPKAAMSASDVLTRWSAEAAPSSTASEAPPMLPNSSAWILSGNPSDRALVRIWRDCSRLKALSSQKTSTKGRDRRGACVPHHSLSMGSIVSQMRLVYPCGLSLYSGGMA